MLRSRVVCLALAVLFATFPSLVHAIDPLTVAGAGITTSLLLHKFDEKATNIVQNAGAVGSLLTSKAARDVQLEIMAARQQLHEELNQNWDRLDGEKVSALRAIDSALEELSKNVAQAGRLEDDLALDVDQQLNKMDWPTSAMSGGFRPPGALRKAQHITCSAPPSRRLSSTLSYSGHRSYSDVRNRIDVPSDTQICSVPSNLAPIRRTSVKEVAWFWLLRVNRGVLGRGP